MKTTIITSKGTTTIPKEIRDLLNLREGSKINFVVEAGKIRIERALTLEEVRQQNLKQINPVLLKLSEVKLRQQADQLRASDLKKKYKS